MLSNNDRIIRKIKKCLALAESANPNESARALEQANKLLEQYKLTMADVEASAIQQAVVMIDTSRRPALWALQITAACARNFQCKEFFCPNYQPGKGAFLFIGDDQRPDLCVYTFDVLYRGLERAVKQYTDENYLGGEIEKRRAIKAYREAWTLHVAVKVKRFAERMGEADESRIDKFAKGKHGDYEPHKTPPSALDDVRTPYELEAAQAGYEAAENVTLNPGVATQDEEKLEPCDGLS